MPKICEICDISFKTYTGHTLHQESKHSEVKPSCEKCGKEFSNGQNLKRHINAIHKGLEKMWKCHHCGKELTFYHRKEHLTFCQNPIRFDCSYCEYKATTKGNLKKHEDHQHRNKTYSCQNLGCEFKASYPSALKRHFESVHERKMKLCEICNHAYSDIRKHIWYAHKRKIELQKFNCIICDKNLSSEKSLKYHVNAFHKERNPKFECKNCGKGFYTQRSLNIHFESIH